MIANLERYKNDLDRLIDEGMSLLIVISSECYPDEFKEKHKEFPNLPDLEDAPRFDESYQSWYTEALFCIEQLLPKRLDDFEELYKPKPKRKEINAENYTISDYLHGLYIESYRRVGKIEAIRKFNQQLEILRSVKKRFESSLFDIKQLVQADLFNSELDSARELNEKGFVRGAGAVAGVVLEKHLAQVCENNKVVVKSKYKYPSINDFNQSLKNDNVIEIETSRFIQFLGELRNLCDHNKEREPEKEKIEELIDGVDKITKTLF